MTAASAPSTSRNAAPAAATAPHGCTHMKLRQAGRCLSHHYDAYTAACGLKTTQYSLLSAVMRSEPVQPNTLAARLNLDASTLTRNLRPLMEHGWVELRPGPDARSRRIVTTAKGRALRLEAQRHWRAAQQALNERLGARKVAELHALLDHLLAEFAVGGGDAAAPTPSEPASPARAKASRAKPARSTR